MTEVIDQFHASAGSPSGKFPRYPLGRKLGGPQSRSGRYGEEKNLSPSGNQTQPLASRYNDWATPDFQLNWYAM
jgi:hypothetical protein